MNANGTEDRLQQALRREADRMDALSGAPLDRVRYQAGRIRRRRRITVAAIAAAAVVAVTVPTALVLRGEPESVAPPATHTQSPTPTPSPTHTPSAPPSNANPGPTVYRNLASIPRGANTFLNYVDADGIVHENGSTYQLPGTMDVSTQFLGYRSGWLVGGGVDNVLREYDSTGKVVASGQYGGMVVSSDRTEGAWLMDHQLYEGSLNTMGEGGAQGTPVPKSSGIVGFLPEGPVLTEGDDNVRIVEGSATKTVPVGMLATTTSQSADLVGGVTGSVAQGNFEGAVFDMKTNTQLWHNEWKPLKFSDDGSLVAAAPAADNGDAEAIAILDARTGKVIARTPKLSGGIYLGFDVAWDQHRVVIPASGGNGKKEALLALATSSQLTRVSDVSLPSEPGGAAYLIFDAQP